MLNLNKKYYSLLTCAIVFFALVFLIIIPNIKKIKSINYEILNQRKIMEEYFAKGQNLKNSKEQYANIKENADELDKIFIKDGSELSLITALEKISLKTNVNQNIDLRADEIKEEGKIKEMPINLRLKGNYNNLMNYLDSIESSDFYINIETLDFSAGQNQIKNKQIPIPEENDQSIIKNDVELNLNISGFIYYYNEN
jgi:Tfp pilus assembly protein PilO